MLEIVIVDGTMLEIVIVDGTITTTITTDECMRVFENGVLVFVEYRN